VPQKYDRIPYGPDATHEEDANSPIESLGRGLAYVSHYRGFIPKGDRVLSYNIIVVPHLRYGLKRRFGTFGSISDLKEGVVQ
jgi:hypothetical protein